MPTKTTSSLALLIVALGWSSTEATTIIVNGTSDVLADDGFCTLRESIISANDDSASGGMTGECAAGSGADTVVLGLGVFDLTIPGDDDYSGDLDVRDDLTLQGSGPSTTVINAAVINRVFDVHPDQAVLMSGLRIQGGSSSSGGGIYVGQDALVSVTDCLITGNSATRGGGIENFGFLALYDSTVSGNSSSERGGGIFHRNHTLYLSQSTVANNTSGGDGGGIYGASNGVIVEESTIHSNLAAGSGGGIAMDSYGAPLQLFNTTVSGNLAGGSGGGIEVYNASLTSKNSTIFGNTAGSRGDAISDYGTVALLNTIIGGNCYSSNSPPVSGGGNIESPGDTCNLTQASDQKNVSAVSLNLGPLADNGGLTLTHFPSPPSAAIDMGLDASCLEDDQRGGGRPIDGDGDSTATCDVGSVEYGALMTLIFDDGFESGNTSAWSSTVE